VIKRLVIGGASLALASAALLATNAQAEPSGACGGMPAGNGASSAFVCVDQGPVTGSVTAAQTGDTSGYVVADGDSTNAGPASGYGGVQVDGASSSVGAVGSSCNDDYSYPAQPLSPDDLGSVGTCP
jgi:hypothetical protein